MRELGAFITFLSVVGCTSQPTYEEALTSIVADCDADQLSSVYEQPYQGMSPFVVDFIVEAERAQPYADCIFSAAKMLEIEEPTVIAGSEHTQTILRPKLVNSPPRGEGLGVGVRR